MKPIPALMRKRGAFAEHLPIDDFRDEQLVIAGKIVNAQHAAIEKPQRIGQNR
jgi:hypothetical protein